MKEGPPQTLPNPEEVEFKILRPGDENVGTSLNGESIIHYVLKSKDRIITAGKDSAISLEEFGDYFFIGGIHVNEALRGYGIGSRLYDEALKLVKAEGKKGLISTSIKRNAESERMWQRFQKEGRTSTVTINGDDYDVLLPSL